MYSGNQKVVSLLLMVKSWSVNVWSSNAHLYVVSQGQYFLRNGSFNLRMLQRLPFPLEQYYWKLRGEMYDPTLYFCSFMGAQFFRTRSWNSSDLKLNKGERSRQRCVHLLSWNNLRFLFLCKSASAQLLCFRLYFVSLNFIKLITDWVFDSTVD